MNYIEECMDSKKPDVYESYGLSEEEYESKWDSLFVWEKERDSLVKTKLFKEPKFNFLLESAYQEANESKSSYDVFEKYVATYLTPGKALELKRNRIVVGQCSMDDRPRIHAMNIAQLAGESLNWDVFLRAHLNIMNDRIDRISDGSWAWESRHTYIKELEELHFDVVSLLLGIALRAEDLPKNHYYGGNSRLGRAIDES